MGMFGFPGYCTESLEDLDPMDRGLTEIMIEKAATRIMKSTLEMENNPATESDIYALTTGSVKTWGLSRDLSSQHIEEVLSMNKVMKFLQQNYSSPVTPEIVCLYNRMIVAGPKSVMSGELRKTNVFIQGTSYVPPDFRDLDRKFDQMFEAVEQLSGSLNKAVSFLLAISKSQFFMDGNKRTARMVALHQCCYGGQKILSPLVDNQEYLKMLRDFYESDNNSGFVEFFKANLFSLDDIRP
ncbi:Fic family protein [Paenibacillus medicaginis]|uniref:Fic family protein n=1 Tax=Paenibacillus medicaginis TaxID=1470560 RepID=A0ABV5C6S9_9BACL